VLHTGADCGILLNDLTTSLYPGVAAATAADIAAKISSFISFITTSGKH